MYLLFQCFYFILRRTKNLGVHQRFNKSLKFRKNHFFKQKSFRFRLRCRYARNLRSFTRLVSRFSRLCIIQQIYFFKTILVILFFFQNHEVIEHTTIPNVVLNSKNEDNKLQNCKFFAGDWKSFMNLVTTKYDFILTSETIYNPDNYQKLLDIFKELLEPDGIVYP